MVLDVKKLKWRRKQASAIHLVSAEAVDVVDAKTTLIYKAFSCGPPSNIVYYAFVYIRTRGKTDKGRRIDSLCLNDVRNEVAAKMMLISACETNRLRLRTKLK